MIFIFLEGLTLFFFEFFELIFTYLLSGFLFDLDLIVFNLESLLGFLTLLGIYTTGAFVLLNLTFIGDFLSFLAFVDIIFYLCFTASGFLTFFFFDKFLILIDY